MSIFRALKNVKNTRASRSNKKILDHFKFI